MKADLRAYLLTDSTISGVVGTDIFIANQQPPESTARTFILIDGVTGNELTAADGGMGVYRDNILIRCISNVEATAQTLFEAVRDLLNRYGGTFGETTLIDSFLDEPTEQPEPEGDGSNDIQYEIAASFLFIWEVFVTTTTTTTTTVE